jgi:hypothetical protein
VIKESQDISSTSSSLAAENKSKDKEVIEESSTASVADEEKPNTSSLPSSSHATEGAMKTIDKFMDQLNIINENTEWMNFNPTKKGQPKESVEIVTHQLNKAFVACLDALSTLMIIFPPQDPSSSKKGKCNAS